MRLFQCLAALIAIFSLNAQVPRDLNDLKQDFILDTKRIILSNFPEAFNPSIVRWKGKLLMSFRTYDPITRSTDPIGLVWLDENFEPMSNPTLLHREGEVSSLPSEAKDARLLVIGEDLYIVYSNLYPYEIPASRMYFAKLCITEEGFQINFPSSVIYFDGEIRERKEKNWVPFDFENNLILTYSLQPHRLYTPLSDTNECHELATTFGNIQWQWGQLMGGTPALRLDDQYLAFFHSNKALATLQSEGQMMNHYFMGAYTFDKEPPFAITGISPYPIIDTTFYEGPLYQTWKPLRVIFPTGLVIDGNTIWVSYGRQDHEMWVARMDKSKLLKTLKPVKTVITVGP